MSNAVEQFAANPATETAQKWAHSDPLFVLLLKGAQVPRGHLAWLQNQGRLVLVSGKIYRWGRGSGHGIGKGKGKSKGR